MPVSFSIQAAAERSGLTPHVIRAWERRYRAIEPARSAGRHRHYSEEEVERLAMLNRATHSGHSIGRIAQLPTSELRALLARDQPAPTTVRSGRDSGAEYRSEVLAAVRGFDEPRAEDWLRRALVALGHQGLLQVLVAPLAEEIGDRWRAGDLTAAHEHFFTSLVKLFLRDVARQYATPIGAPRIVVSTPPGQLHELGAIMTAGLAANLGWRVLYLGPSLPAHEIAGAVAANEAVAVALSVVYPEDDPSVATELEELARLLPAGTGIIVGGRAARAYFETIVKAGAVYADSLAELGEKLEAIRRGPRPATAAPHKKRL